MPDNSISQPKQTDSNSLQQHPQNVRSPDQQKKSVQFQNDLQQARQQVASRIALQQPTTNNQQPTTRRPQIDPHRSQINPRSVNTWTLPDHKDKTFMFGGRRLEYGEHFSGGGYPESNKKFANNFMNYVKENADAELGEE